MIPKKLYLNYVNDSDFENDVEITWSEEHVDVAGCKMLNREYTDLSQVWHDASEEPDKSGSLVLFANGVLVLVREYTSWEEVKSKYNFSKWAYYDSFVTKNKIELVDTELLLEEK